MRHLRWTGAAAGLVVLGLLAAAALGKPSGSPTRLVHGPVVFRLTGFEKVDPGSTGRDEYRYFVLFKLSRIIRMRPRGGGAGHTSYGDYSILDVALNVEPSPMEFGGPGCLALIEYGPGGTEPTGGFVTKLLDKKRLGSKIKVKIRPFTRGADGKPKLGKTYVTYPRLREADVTLRGKTARRELKRIGCKNRPLP